MSTYDLYTSPVPKDTWDVPAAGAARFSWEYDDGRQRLLDLYQRGKDKQWDATKRIDWDQPVVETNVMEAGDEICPIYGSRQWEKLNEAERDEVSHHLSSWLFSQFLHGEQGALTVAARIVESVPDMDSKFYAATVKAPCSPCRNWLNSHDDRWWLTSSRSASFSFSHCRDP